MGAPKAICAWIGWGSYGGPERLLGLTVDEPVSGASEGAHVGCSSAGTEHCGCGAGKYIIKSLSTCASCREVLVRISDLGTGRGLTAKKAAIWACLGVYATECCCRAVSVGISP
jgi:hypothetical protein